MDWAGTNRKHIAANEGDTVNDPFGFRFRILFTHFAIVPLSRARLAYIHVYRPSSRILDGFEEYTNHRINRNRKNFEKSNHPGLIVRAYFSNAIEAFKTIDFFDQKKSAIKTINRPLPRSRPPISGEPDLFKGGLRRHIKPELRAEVCTTPTPNVDIPQRPTANVGNNDITNGGNSWRSATKRTEPLDATRSPGMCHDRTDPAGAGKKLAEQPDGSYLIGRFSSAQRDSLPFLAFKKNSKIYYTRYDLDRNEVILTKKQNSTRIPLGRFVRFYKLDNPIWSTNLRREDMTAEKSIQELNERNDGAYVFRKNNRGNITLDYKKNGKIESVDLDDKFKIAPLGKVPLETFMRDNGLDADVAFSPIEHRNQFNDIQTRLIFLMEALESRKGLLKGKNVDVEKVILRIEKCIERAILAPTSFKETCSETDRLEHHVAQLSRLLS